MNLNKCGHLPYDADIHIDYENQKVDFDYLVCTGEKVVKKDLRNQYLGLLLGFEALTLVLWLLLVSLWDGITHFSISDTTATISISSNGLILALGFIIINLILSCLLVYLHFHPKTSAYVSKIIPRFNTLFTGTNYKKTITEFKEKTIEFHIGQCARLEWDAFGDAKKYLSEVKMEAEWVLDSDVSGIYPIYLYVAKFVFKELPKDGILEVRWG